MTNDSGFGKEERAEKTFEAASANGTDSTDSSIDVVKLLREQTVANSDKRGNSGASRHLPEAGSLLAMVDDDVPALKKLFEDREKEKAAEKKAEPPKSTDKVTEKKEVNGSEKTTNKAEQFLGILTDDPAAIAKFANQLVKGLDGLKEFGLTNNHDGKIGFSVKTKEGSTTDMISRPNLQVQRRIGENLNGNIELTDNGLKVSDIGGVSFPVQIGKRGRLGGEATVTGVEIGKDGKITSRIHYEGKILKGININVNANSPMIEEMQKTISDALADNKEILSTPEFQKVLEALKGVDSLTVTPDEKDKNILNVRVKGKPLDIPVDPEASKSQAMKIDRISIPGDVTYRIKTSENGVGIESINPPIKVHGKVGGLVETTIELKGADLKLEPGKTPELNVNVEVPSPFGGKIKKAEKIDLGNKKTSALPPPQDGGTTVMAPLERVRKAFWLTPPYRAL